MTWCNLTSLVSDNFSTESSRLRGGERGWGKRGGERGWGTEQWVVDGDGEAEMGEEYRITGYRVEDYRIGVCVIM